MKEKNKPTRQKGNNMKLEEVNLKTKEAVDYLVQSLESGQSAVAHAVSRSDGEVPKLQPRQHHAHCEAEARRYPRRRIPHLTSLWPLRPAWREGHFHSRSNGRQQAQ